MVGGDDQQRRLPQVRRLECRDQPFKFAVDVLGLGGVEPPEVDQFRRVKVVVVVAQSLVELLCAAGGDALDSQWAAGGL